MPGQAPENHRKNTVVKKQKNMHSAYPQSDGVRSESARKSSGSVKTLELETGQHGIGSSMVQNWKQDGVKLETVRHELPCVESSTEILTVFSQNAKFV